MDLTNHKPKTRNQKPLNDRTVICQLSTINYHLSSNDRQLHKERRSLPFFGFKPDLSAGLFDNAFAHGETEAGTGGFGREIGCEDPRAHFFRNAFTIVLYTDGNMMVL